jgi:hypothetical protein
VPTINPFSSRFIRPGSIGYIDAGQGDADAIFGRWQMSGWRGQIVGPHGSGKSTLLADLLERFDRRQQTLRTIRVTSSRQSIKQASSLIHKLPKQLGLAVDGFEQLPWWCRRLVLNHSRHPLIITTHQRQPSWRQLLPVLATTATDSQLASRVVEAVLAMSDSSAIDLPVAAAYRNAGGNLREMLFLLYDHYHRHQR